MRRFVALWLIFRGEILFDINLALGPHATLSNATRPVIRESFEQLKSENAVSIMATTAFALRDYVRSEQQRLQHRNVGVVEMEKLFFLPRDDLEYWLSPESDLNAFGRFESEVALFGGVFRRLLLLELSANNISARLERERLCLCCVCGVMLFPYSLRWRALSPEQCRFPPRDGPSNIHCPRFASVANRQSGKFAVLSVVGVFHAMSRKTSPQWFAFGCF